ncbi:MAG: Zn-ribbon domain-containing OB-fold protein [Dehalococcoidia bacterium]|nr:Zn-ribbon domain-containing OB-fold protein [Dehalococcoidia bacterium]
MALENKFSDVAENKLYSLAYNKLLSEHKLMGSRCKKCGHLAVPPKPICPECYGSEMELEEMKGRGKLVAYTVVAVGSPLMVEEGYGREKYYCCGIVELEEGAKICARISGVDTSKPEQIKIGTPVALDYVEATHAADPTHEEGERTFLSFKALS